MSMPEATPAEVMMRRVDRPPGRPYGKGGMAREPHVEVLMKKLLRAIEVSLAATDAARDAVQEILRQGADTGIFFAGAKGRGPAGSELTPQDKEFLRAVSIRPDR